MYKTARSSNDLTQMVYVAHRKKILNVTTLKDFHKRVLSDSQAIFDFVKMNILM